MALNDPYAFVGETAYKPRLSIRLLNAAQAEPTAPIDDSPVDDSTIHDPGEIPFALSAEVTCNNWYQADHFAAEFALWSDPDFGPGFWSSREEILLDIRYLLDQDTPTSLIIGKVDHIDLDWAKGTVRVEGRDLTSNFLDHRTYASHVNKTSSQIAAELAARYNMQADIDPTTDPVSRFYEGEHDYLEKGEFTRSISEWDLLTYLAQHEGGYDVYVTGTTLHFKKSKDLDVAEPWRLVVDPPDYQTPGMTGLLFANLLDLKMTRALTLAKDVVVVVRSWNSGQKRAYNVSSPKTSSSSQSKYPSQKYVYTRPNLTKDQAQKFADMMRAQITQHERLITWSEAGGYPGALALTPRDCLQVEGTNSDWDQRYYIDTISRHLSVGGLTMSVRAKNHSTTSEVQSI